MRTGRAMSCEMRAIVLVAAVTAVVHTGRAGAVTARWRFEDAYDNVADGAWYRDSNNEEATLAWGESYVMMSLAAMFRGTNDPRYLDRLAFHADGVLAQRDDARGVADYRGVSGACWQNRHYQPDRQPYCYVVHSGMIGYPIAELARLVRASGMEDEVAYDGVTFGAKADAYVAALAETIAFHDDQWRAAGYYVFRPDASFLDYPGRDLPLNQSNAMGRLLLAMADLTGDASYIDKATRLAERFRAQITASGGAYLWNYWGGVYASPGEDVSHAAINVDFAVMAAAQGVVFTEADLAGFATTFLANVYRTDRSFSDHVGGGSADGSSFRPQVGRWLRLTPVRTGIYTAVRDLYELDYPPGSITSGSLLLAWAYLAELEPVHCEHFFYYVDWLDPDPAVVGDWRQATAYGANVLTTPPDFTQGCMIPLEVDAARRTRVQQWDGEAYHTVCEWEPTGGESSRFVPFDTRWPFIYWDGGVLFQLADEFVAGAGIRVRESPGLTPPSITSTPPAEAALGEPFSYAATGTGDSPFWWSLREFPTGARIDAATGVLTYVPVEPATFHFLVRLENDAGRDDQAFDLFVRDPATGDGDADVDGDADADGVVDADSDVEAVPDGDVESAPDADASPDAGPAEDSGHDVDARVTGGCGCMAAPSWRPTRISSLLP